MAQEVGARWVPVPLQGWQPKTESECQSARAQLERMLAHPLFAHSKRYPVLFRHVVERAISGQVENLKERTLGIEVFGRQADYDTNMDPVVRITAGEIRKRIAQYYHEEQHGLELRIDMPAGSYIPTFHRPNGFVDPLAASPSTPPAMAQPLNRQRPLPRGLRKGIYFSFACVSLIAGLALVEFKPWRATAAVDEFWGPVLDSQGPVLISIGETDQATDPSYRGRQGLTETVADHIKNVDHIVLSDASALLNVTGFLGKAGRPYRLQGSAATSLTDLRQGPAILISGFDNPWTLRLTDPLRFHFSHQPTTGDLFCIEDRENSFNRWSVDFATPYSKLTEDYALIARYVDQTTGQLVVVAAGIGGNGTTSAGEFLTDKKFIAQLVANAPKDWEYRNVEAVIETQVIDGKSGPPKVVAVHFW